MKTLRKIIVRSCALTLRIRKTGGIPRISAVVTALFFLDIIINELAGTLGTSNWYDLIFIALFVILGWIGFNWFGLGYFQLWPIQFHELDDYQKYMFSRVMFHELTEDEADEVIKIIDNHPEWF